MDAGPAQPPGEGPPPIETRARILDFVRRTPGAHLRAIQRALAMPYGTVEYHLHAMERDELVRTVADGNLHRYFAVEFAFADRAVLGLLRKPPVRAAVVALLGGGELTHQDLAQAAGVKPPTLSYHLPEMEAAHVVITRRDGRFTHVRLADPALMQRVLIAHGRSLSDAAVDRFLDTWSGFELPPRAGELQGESSSEAGDEKKIEKGGLRPPKVG